MNVKWKAKLIEHKWLCEFSTWHGECSCVRQFNLWQNATQ
jgi:hypothetical protein